MKKLLIPLLAFTLCLFSAMVVNAEDEEIQQYTVQAELTAVTPLAEFKGEAKQTHSDPQFAISLKMADGSTDNYLIHSLTPLFYDGYVIGGKYTFLIRYYPNREIKYEIHVIKYNNANP